MANDFKEVLSRKKFVYLWTSQLLSQATINIMNFLLLAHLYVETESTIATSLLWIAYSLPALFLGPIGAASVDLVSRRKMLMFTNLLQALTIFTYIFLDQKSIFILYAVVLMYSILNQFYGPAEASYLPSTVNKKELPHANSIFLITQQSSIVLGFGLAGIIQRVIGFNGALVLCSVFLFIAFISTSFLTEIAPDKKIPDKIENLIKTFFDSIMEGYQYIKKNNAVLFPLLILLGIQAALAIVIVSLPVIATQILHISVNYSGVSIVVPAGIGAVAGSIYVPRLIKQGWRKKTIIETSLGLVAFSVLALSLGIPYLPLGLRLTATPILILLSGFSFVGIDIPALTFLQNETPLWLRGRVFGNLWFLVTIVTIFPVLFSGAITEIFGIRTLFSLMGILALVGLVISMRKGQKFINERF